MKKILAIAALMIVNTTLAAELKFGDLNYFFKQGQSNLRADVSLDTLREKIAGTTNEKDGYLLDAQYLYGISDQFNAFVGLDYAFGVDVKDGTGTHNQDGLSNPRLGVNYRAMRQQDAGVNIDFGLIASLNVQDEERGSGKEDGNNSNGRNGIEFNARLGNKWDEANEYYFLAGVVYNTAGEYDLMNATGSTMVDVDSSMDYRLGIFYQYRPVNEFMTTLGLEGIQYGERKEEPAGGTEVTYDTHMDAFFNFTAKYLVTSNFIAKLKYEVGLLPDYDVETSEINRRRFRSIGLGVDYLF